MKTDSPKNIYVSSLCENGGVYRFGFEKGKLCFADKTYVPFPMYTVYREGRLWTLLKLTDKKNRFGGVMSFEVAGDGRLTDPSVPVSSGGVCPCHIEACGNDVYIANYQSGNIVSLKGKTAVHKGSGPDPKRQDTAHTHFVGLSPDKKYLLACDLGLDRVYTYDLELNRKSEAAVPPGHGARHLAYSDDGKYVYSANELGSTVTAFSYSDGVLTQENTCSCVGSDKENYPAAIRYKDGFLYVSNRGEDTIACLKAEGKKLELASLTPSCGSFPLDICFADGYLICANKKSDNLAVFSEENGALTLVSLYEGIKSPVCVTAI